MDPVIRSCELGRRYLDGEATPAELAELEALLRGRPAAADAFARLARLEADLTAVFAEEQALRRQTEVVRRIDRAARRRRLWLAGLQLLLAAGVLFLVGGTVLRWLSQPGPGAATADGHKVLSGTLLVAGRVADRIPDGEEVRVAGPSAAEVRLSDGSSALLEPASRAVLHGRADGLGPLVELVEGEGHFEVYPGTETFQVETSLGRITALGTEFTVKLTQESGGEPMKSYEAVLAVAVWAGVVQIDIGPVSQLLAAGESRVFVQKKSTGDGDGKPKGGTVRAVIAEVSGSKVTVTADGKGGKEMSFDVAADVKISVEGKPAKLADLTRGMHVVIEREDKTTVRSIRAQGPMVAGVLKSVEKGQLTLARPAKKGQAAEDAVYPLGPDVQLLVQGKPGKLTDLKANEQVTMKLSADGKRVVQILVGRKGEAKKEGGKQAVKAGGEIKAIDAAGRSITLAGGKGAGEHTYKVAADAKISVAGTPGKLDALKVGMRILLKLDAEGKTAKAINVGERKREK